jgi:transcriptional regulator with XRE-family HTH domain
VSQTVQDGGPGLQPEQFDTLGGRIRRLRQERGLSLANVAEPHFSRAFLHQVELGRSQPSTRVLRVIASRLGAPVEYLLEGAHPSLDQEIAVEQARIVLARGQPEQALQILKPMLGNVPWPVGSDARLTAAEALRRLGDPAQADALLAAEEKVLRDRGDTQRMSRLRSIRGGRSRVTGAEGHLRRAEQSLRAGERAAALEHYRTARVLYEEGKS